MGVLRPLAAMLLVLATSCIGTTPEERLRADQGNYDDGDEEHRPGQPCLVCHGADYNPGGPVFVVAGTVFADPLDDDENGLEGAQVHITDAEGRTFTAETNTAGNFMVQVESGLSSPQQGRRGRLRIPYTPTFPLRAEVEFEGASQEMESRIWKDGSCASCHRGSTASEGGVEKIWVFE